MRATPIESSVKLDWTPLPVGGFYYYEVEGRVANSPFQLVDIAPGGGATLGFDPTLPEGTPVSFRVRAVKGEARSAYSNEAATVSAKPFFALAALPAPGGALALDGFTADFFFNKEIDPASIQTVSATFVDADGMPLSTTVSSGTDGKSVHLLLGAPLETAGVVSATVAVRDRKGSSATISGGPWFAWTVQVFRNQELRILPTNGTLAIALPQPIGPVQPQRAVLYAGAMNIADLGPPPWGTFVWDTRSVPEGSYRLSVRIPGFAANESWSAGPTVRVDRTPAHVRCVPDLGQPDQLGVKETIHLVADEAVENANPVLLVDGIEQPTHAFPPKAVPSDLNFDFGAALPHPPFVQSISLGSYAHDVAGNPVLLDGCTFQVRPWLAPWGPLLGSGPSSVVASALAFDALQSFSRVLSMAWIPPSGAPSAGQLLAASFRPDSAIVPVALSSAGAVASSVSLAQGVAAWTERVSAGPGAVMVATQSGTAWTLDPAGPFNFDRTHDADHVAVTRTEAPQVAGGFAIAWSEADGAGGRALRAIVRGFNGWSPQSMDVGATAGGVADFPALTSDVPASEHLYDAFLTFLDIAPGGVPQVRAAKGGLSFNGSGFVPIPGSLNADASAAASGPGSSAYAGAVVAWAEAGKVYARTIDVNFGILSAPVVLNADANHSARSPLVTARKVVVFIEAGLGGDEIQVRRWTAGAWNDLGVLNAGDTGAVTALAVSPGPLYGPGPLIGWADANAVVHLRVGNF